LNILKSDLKFKKYLEEYLEWGSFPEIVLEKIFYLKEKILSEYFRLLVHRDLKDRFSIENTYLLEIDVYFSNKISNRETKSLLEFKEK